MIEEKKGSGYLIENCFVRCLLSNYNMKVMVLSENLSNSMKISHVEAIPIHVLKKNGIELMSIYCAVVATL